uniref:CP-type G domain-containing protein n=1 Tax=Rhodosorus marinus TaxID=101924 RepID=A0A7S2ZDL1_9RHOD|mmetsp:Transcript_15405/g.62863  ORF Transcript_15405/g.62863 Transcript_15405/m.62863 type:complete len:360 (+) Transcript_15405:214-1293(+)
MNTMLLFVSAGQVNAFSSNARVGSRCGYRRVRPEVVAMAKGRDKLPEEGLVRPLINWYPGHIAKAEKKLKEMLSVVDVVIEMRDCRIPRSTAHPLVEKWVGVKPRVVAMNRSDMAPEKAKVMWKRHLADNGLNVFFTNAQKGEGVPQLRRAALQAGAAMNEKRKKRGLLPRPVRCMVLGYPNVGKSALINRLVNKRAAKSENRPGVTRGLQWVRISKDIELLDTPGIIPMKLVSQLTASRLAVCDDIGEASYDNQLVAAFLAEELRSVSTRINGFVDMERIEERYGVKFGEMAGDEYLFAVADKSFAADTERFARRFLTDFRSGLLGELALESPDERETEENDARGEENQAPGAEDFTF